MGGENSIEKKILSKITEECFWDYKISPEEVIKMAKSNNSYLKKFLFGKILENSTNVIRDLPYLFNKEEIEQLLKEYKSPPYKREFIERRKKIIEYIILNKKVKIEELEWKS